MTYDEFQKLLDTKKFPFVFQPEEILHFDAIKHRIIFKLLPYRSNEELLATIPHRFFHDLAVCYLILYSGAPQSGVHGTVLITEEILNRWFVSEEELFACASVNTPLLLPHQLYPMEDLLYKLAEKAGKMNLRFPDFPEDSSVPPLLVLTNRYGFLGATCLLYDGLLKKLSNQFESSFYILPSSLHEVILIPNEHCHRLSELSRMVHDVNTNVLNPADILSDHAYFYHQKLDILT